MMKNRILVAGDGTTNIQANNVNIVLPDKTTFDNEPLKAIDELLDIVSGLRSSSFLVESEQLLEYSYKRIFGVYRSNAPLYLIASLTEELALVKMDLGRISGSNLAAIPLFLRACALWKKLGNNSGALFSFHMLGVCCGIVGKNERAIAIYRLCLNNLPATKKYDRQNAHVSRDLGISLNRSGAYTDARKYLEKSMKITSYWHSDFNFGLDAQKLAISLAGSGDLDYSISLIETADKILSLRDDLSYVKNLNAKHFFAIKSGDEKLAVELKREIFSICDAKGFPHQKSIVQFQEITGQTK